MFRTVGDQVWLWEAVLPAELLKLPDELAWVDGLLDDPVFFARFVPFFDPRIGRPSTPMETYLRLMFLKFRYRLGYESLCREVSGSITWRRFCRIPLDGVVPHPTTLMKLTTRCGTVFVSQVGELRPRNARCIIAAYHPSLLGAGFFMLERFLPLSLCQETASGGAAIVVHVGLASRDAPQMERPPLPRRLQGLILSRENRHARRPVPPRRPPRR